MKKDDSVRERAIADWMTDHPYDERELVEANIDDTVYGRLYQMQVALRDVGHAIAEALGTSLN